MVINSRSQGFNTNVLIQGLDDIAQLNAPVFGTISHKKGWPDAL